MRSAPLLLLALLLPAVSAFGQDERSAQALSRAQSLLRQVSAQKQELEVANARMTAELATLEKEKKRLEAKLKDTSLDLESTERKNDRNSQLLELTQERLARTEDTLREGIERLRSTNAELFETQQARAELEATLAETEAELADSERKNLELYQANVELLELYRKKGPIDGLLQREPVTGLKSVEIENILQEYRFKLEDALRDANQAKLGSGTSSSSPR